MSLDPENDLIFVSIAAYRDPQLIATIADCLLKANDPARLRFGICRQHGADEQAFAYPADNRFHLLDIPWQDSKGACWARAEAMKMWRGERWFLQVDSHCRFAHGWDDRLIRMMEQTASPKPILSTYATAFTPGKNEVLEGPPLQMAFQGFTADGIPHMKPAAILNWQSLDRPLRARFVSGGFLFAGGNLVKEVPYDPELYFLGEEAAMTVRAFTSGYDLFHPCETLVWHDYVRKDAVRHWDDHTVRWGEQDLESKNKIRKLLLGQPLKAFGLGSARTLGEYEEYAGISFRLRKAQDYTVRSEEPPNPKVDANWVKEIFPWLVRIRMKNSEFPVDDWSDFSFWYVGVCDENHHEIYRRDLSPEELAPLSLQQPEIEFVCELQSGSIPAFWTVWPVSRSRGWLRKIEGKLEDEDFTILREEDE